jgi:hypothetical protein
MNSQIAPASASPNRQETRVNDDEEGIRLLITTLLSPPAPFEVQVA